jgi:hypothetical protein
VSEVLKKKNCNQAQDHEEEALSPTKSRSIAIHIVPDILIEIL